MARDHRKGSSYLAATRQGNTQGWRYLVGVYLNFLIWFCLSWLVFRLALGMELITEGETGIEVSDPIHGYILANLMFGFWGLGLWGVMGGLHRRSWRTLVRANGLIRWRRVLQGFGVWLILIGAPTLMAYGLDPQILSLSLDWQRWLPFAALAAIMTPMQTTVEELFFRGYLIQGFSLISTRSGFLCGISALIFTLPHLNNPEVAHGFWPLCLYYFAFGLVHAWITLQDGGLELAIGLHAANNLFVALFVTYHDAVMETPALFSSRGIDPLGILLGFLIRSLAFCYLFFPPWRGLGSVQPQPDQDLWG